MKLFKRKVEHRPRVDVVNDWLDELQGLSRTLDDVTAQIDGRFVRVGEAVQSFIGRSQTLSAEVGGAFELMTGAGITNTLNGLAELEQKLNQNMGSAGYADRLNEMLSSVDLFQHINASLDESDYMITQLGLLGMMTRIENAHVSDDRSNFAVLASDVRRIAEIIREHSGHIRQDAGLALERIDGARCHLNRLEQERQDQSGAVLQRASGSRRELRSSYDAISDEAGALQQGSQVVNAAVGRIIAAMQYNDITRQKVEHVSQTITELPQRIAQQEPEFRVAYLHQVCALQLGQLDAARRDLGSAIQNIRDEVEGVSSVVDQVVQGVRRVMQAAGEVSLIAEFSGSIESAMGCLDQAAAIQAEIGSTMNNIWGAIEGMSSRVHDVERVGFDLQLIALNSRIMAAHMGVEGRTLDAISGSIYEMSRETQQKTDHLAGLLSQMARISRSALQSASGESQQDLNVEMRGAMQGLICELKSLDAQLQETLQVVEDGLGIFAAELKQTSDYLDESQQLQEMLVHEVSVIERIVAGARELCSDEQLARVEIETSDERYTMQSERDVHRGEFDELGEDLADNVELF